MPDFKFVLDKDAVREWLRGEDVQGLVDGYAADLAAGLPEGYALDSRKTDRSVATIHAESPSARADNNKNNTLLKVLG